MFQIDGKHHNANVTWECVSDGGDTRVLTLGRDGGGWKEEGSQQVGCGVHGAGAGAGYHHTHHWSALN